MRKGLQIALVVFLVAIASLVMWQVFHNREPAYQGKRLTVWIDEFAKSWLFPDARGEAQAAIREIGTNALPLLLQWTAAQDSVLKKKVMVLVARQRLFKISMPSEDDYDPWLGTGGLRAGFSISVSEGNSNSPSKFLK